MQIPITKTQFTEDDFNSIIKPLKSGWVVQGPFVEEFEKKWCGFTGSAFSVAVSNCTTALTVSLYACGIKPGDEVIVPSFTWIATANAVEVLGAKPVFCDIESETFNIDCNLIPGLITPETKAIIPVHLFGLSSDIDEVNDIASNYNLTVIEDAACGFSGMYKGKHVGTFGTAGCFSFHPRKAITTGEGGMVTVQNIELASKIRSLRDHGASVSDIQRHYGNKPYLLPEFHYAGFNFRMTDLQASIGTTQMDRAFEIAASRKKIAGKYTEFLNNIDWLTLSSYSSDYEHGYQSFVCLFSPEKINPGNIDHIHKRRNCFMDYLHNKGISTRPGTHAVHLQKYYSCKYGIQPHSLINSLISDRCSIAFPLYPAMTDDEFGYITDSIKSYNIHKVI